MASSSSSTATSTSDLKTLDATRQRLWQLSNALQNLKTDLQFHDVPPPWSKLADTTALTSHQLQATASFLSAPAPARTLAASRAYPAPSFADLSHGPVVEQLLRKKAERSVEDWTAAGRAAGADAGAGVRGAWAWAARAAFAASEETPWGIDYTVAERERGVENVRHGLKRVLDDGMEEGSEEEDDDDEEGEEDAMAVDAAPPQLPGGGPQQEQEQERKSPPPPPLDDLLRFMSNGSVSPALAAAGAR